MGTDLIVFVGSMAAILELCFWVAVFFILYKYNKKEDE